VFDYKEDGSRASYSIERYHMTDLALRYVHGAIGEDEFRDICRILFHFISIRKIKQVSDEEYENSARSLYIDKVDERTERLKSMEGYERIRDYIAIGTEYKDIDEITDRYKSLYHRITDGRRFKKVLAVAHGDLCFSNILYNHDLSLLKLIDPKGAETEDELYMNPYYDIAKLSHSICGSYDYFNSDQYEISIGADMRLKLTVDSDNDRYISIFREYLEENAIDPELIRLYEASLFLSMLPLHMDREKKVLGFILNAVNILDELERGL
jgi:thiamine kinase-like enzyme